MPLFLGLPFVSSFSQRIKHSFSSLFSNENTNCYPVKLPLQKVNGNGLIKRFFYLVLFGSVLIFQIGG